MKSSYQYICFSLVLVIRCVLNSPLSRTNYDVDEFCDKLLSSNKFEKLIERVAEKAAEKITEISHHEVISDAKKSNRAEKKVDDDETETKKEKANEKTAVSKKVKSLASKMALIKKYSIAPLSDLTLQYKNFVKTSPSTNITKSTEEGAINHKESKEKPGKLSDSDSPKSKTRLKDGTSFERDDSKSESQDGEESSEFINEKRIERARLDSDEKYASDENVTSKKNSTPFHNKETEGKYTEEESSKENAVIKSHESHVDISIVKKNKKEKPKNNEKDEHYGSLIENEFSVETYNGAELTAQDNEDKEDKPETVAPVKKPAEPIFRREGEKVYTYQVSSDYDEYHEQLKKAKERKSRKSNSKPKSKSVRKAFQDISF